MDDKIITLATLTYEKAQLVKSLLENEGVTCFLEHLNLIQGSISSGVKINISEADFEKAMIVFDSIRESEFDFKHKDIKIESDIKILVPVDFSEYSEKAMDFAFDWVSKLKGEITLFNSYFSPLHAGLPFNDSYVYDINLDEVILNLKEENDKQIKILKDKLEKKVSDNNIKGVTIKTEVHQGVAEQEILNYSKIYNPAIIVMGTRGADRKVVDLIGSVTSEIIELAKKPVLAIPESFSYQGLETINSIGHLVVFDEPDYNAVEILSNIVHPLNVTIKCCHISTPSNLQKNKVKMDGLVEHFHKHPVKSKLEFTIIENEDFLVGIESFVQSESIDILSFTAFKRNLISRLLNPSIAKKMLFHTTTPILVFHA